VPYTTILGDRERERERERDRDVNKPDKNLVLRSIILVERE
jgi:hypothetical protein